MSDMPPHNDPQSENRATETPPPQDSGRGAGYGGGRSTSAGTTNVNLPRAIIGALVVFFGLLILADSYFDIDSERWVGFLIAFIFLAIGVYKASSAKTDRGRRGSAFFILFGLFILFIQLNLFPLFVVAVGAFILWTALGRGRVPLGRRVTPEGSDTLNDFIIFGGTERRATSQNLRGGDLTALFGGLDLDLRDATLAPEGATFDVFVMFGGMDLRVPEGWDVIPEASVVFGGLEDKTRSDRPGTGTGEPRPRLIIRGFVLFGGLDVTH